MVRHGQEPVRERCAMNDADSDAMLYVPPPQDAAWRRAEDGETGLDAAAVAAATGFATAHETPWPRDLAAVLGQGYFEPPPWNEIIGPVAPRGGPNGVVLHRGMIVAEWGD